MSKLEQDKNFRMESLNALFEYATEGIIISDSSGLIIKANPSSEKLFGYEAGELVGKVIETLVPTKYKQSHSSYRQGYNKSPHPRSMGKNMELAGMRKDGSEFPVEISLSSYTKDDTLYAIAFIIDITERKKHQESVKRLNQELEKKVEERTKVLHEALIELENSKDQLSHALENEKELNDMKSRFVTMASHEFRTPLSTILSSISLVSKYGEGDEKISRHVQRIKSAVTNMTLILNDFLSAEKLEQGKVLMQPGHHNLKGLAEETLSEIHGLLKPGQKVNHVYRGDEMAYFDLMMVKNIFLNLLSNAIKFSPENKTIQLHIQVDSALISIVVADQGIGIPPEEKQFMFDRFFRARNVTNIQGTGLGLNIVSKYVENMKGTIEFESELNVGTKFTICLPNKTGD